jgi:hypothetical protein
MRKLIAFALFVALHAACGSDTPSGPGNTSTTTGGTGTQTPAADFTVANTPCVAPSAGPVSCSFNGSATGLGANPTFEWTFTNPNGTAPNNQVSASGQTTSPTLPCSFSSGVVSFNVTVLLTIRPATGVTGAPATVTRTQSITRAAGACGT